MRKKISHNIIQKVVQSNNMYKYILIFFLSLFTSNSYSHHPSLVFDAVSVGILKTSVIFYFYNDTGKYIGRLPHQQPLLYELTFENGKKRVFKMESFSCAAYSECKLYINGIGESIRQFGDVIKFRQFHE